MTDPRNMPPSASSDEDAGELDLKDIVAQLFARKFWIILAILVGALIGAFRGQLPPDVYQASAVVQIEQRSDRIALPAELIGDVLTGNTSGSSGLATEVHIIRSRLVLEPVVTSLSLNTIVVSSTAPVVGDILQRRSLPLVDGFLGQGHVRPGEDIDAVLSDLDPDYLGGSFLIRITGADTYSVLLAGGVMLRGEVGEPLDLPEGGEILVTEINAPVGREFTVRERSLRSSIRHISSGLSIRERGSTGIVDFRYQSGDVAEAVAILNAVIDEYISQNRRRQSVQIERSIQFIEDQLLDLSVEVDEANEALAEFRQDRQMEELSVGTQELLETGVAIETRLEELAFEKEQLLQVLTVNHPDVQRIEVEETRLQNRLEEIRESLADVPDVERDLAQLVQRVERSEALELQLTERVEQLRVLRASAVGNIRVLEPAEVADLVGPDRRQPIAFGAGLGLIISVALILAINFMRRGVEDAREIEALGLPLFATVNKSKVLIGKGADDPEYGLVQHDPGDITVEALRGLRTGLKFAMASAGSNSLMITSCAPSDGKSFITLNLAMVAGKAGSRVLLIDADMRRGFLRRYFKYDRKHKGLSDVLSGSDENHIKHFDKEGVDFLATGRFPPNPSELLDGRRFDELLAAANEDYDLVLIDAPPVLAVADAAIIGQHVGMSMLVVRHLNTTTAEIQSAQKGLSTSGVRLSGAILNQFDQERSRYGRYGQRYGHYYGGYRYSYRTEDSEADS